MTPQEPNKCLQMFYLSAIKRDGRAARHLCAKLVVVASDKWVNNHNHFLSTYLTVKLRGPVNRYHIAITNHLQFNKKLSGCLWHPNYGMGLLSRKKDKIADDSPLPLQLGTIFAGRGRVFQVVWWTDLEVDLEQTQNHCVELLALYPQLMSI